MGRGGLPECSHSLCCLSYCFFKLPGLCPCLREMGGPELFILLLCSVALEIFDCDYRFPLIKKIIQCLVGILCVSTQSGLSSF